MLIIFIHVSSLNVYRLTLPTRWNFYTNFTPKLLITNDIKGDVDSSNAPPPNKRNPLPLPGASRIRRKDGRNKLYETPRLECDLAESREESSRRQNQLTFSRRERWSDKWQRSVYPESRSYQPASLLSSIFPLENRRKKRRRVYLSISLPPPMVVDWWWKNNTEDR